MVVGDSVTLKNCSFYDGGFTNCYWDFGDGEGVYSSGNKSIKHAYTYADEFNITLSIGEKENTSAVSKAIIVE